MDYREVKSANLECLSTQDIYLRGIVSGILGNDNDYQYRLDIKIKISIYSNSRSN